MSFKNVFDCLYVVVVACSVILALHKTFILGKHIYAKGYIWKVYINQYLFWSRFLTFPSVLVFLFKHRTFGPLQNRASCTTINTIDIGSKMGMEKEVEDVNLSNLVHFQPSKPQPHQWSKLTSYHKLQDSYGVSFCTLWGNRNKIYFAWESVYLEMYLCVHFSVDLCRCL